MQYASTCPSAPASTTASGPCSKRVSVLPAGVGAGAALFAPGRRDAGGGPVRRAGPAGASVTGAEAEAGAEAGACVSSVAVMPATSGSRPADGVRASAGADAPVDVTGASATAAVSAGAG